MSVAVFKSYFAFFQRGTGVILAANPWRVFIELGKKHIVLKHLGWHEYPSSFTFGTEKQMFPFPKVVNSGCYEMLERFN